MVKTTVSPSTCWWSEVWHAGAWSFCFGLSGLWSAATVDPRLYSKVAGNAVKVWRWFWNGGGGCRPQGGRSPPPLSPPVLGWGEFRSQFCGWQVARVHSCITAPKKKSAEEIRTLMETFVKSSPFVIAVVQWDESSPVLVPCYSTSAALSVMKLLSFVLPKTKTQTGLKLVPAHSAITLMQV